VRLKIRKQGINEIKRLSSVFLLLAGLIAAVVAVNQSKVWSRSKAFEGDEEIFLRGWPRAPQLRDEDIPIKGTKKQSPEPSVSPSVVAGWEISAGGYKGHGRGLDASSPDGTTLLLGSPEYKDGKIPVGWVQALKKFDVTEQHHILKLVYSFFTYDRFKSVVNTSQYFDTLEGSIGIDGISISNGARKGEDGCSEKYLNPNNKTVVPNGNGLIFCLGGIEIPPHKLYEIDNAILYVDLSAFKGKEVPLYLTLWSREYSTHWDNKGLWNTYALIHSAELQ
jgi:hypothetical protein